MGNSITLATWWEELTHQKRPWCWERLKAKGEGGGRRWDGWMASLTQWTWVWASSMRWWRTEKPGVLHFMGSQRVGHDLATEQQLCEILERWSWYLYCLGLFHWSYTLEWIDILWDVAQALCAKKGLSFCLSHSFPQPPPLHFPRAFTVGKGVCGKAWDGRVEMCLEASLLLAQMVDTSASLTSGHHPKIFRSSGSSKRGGGVRCSRM